MSISDRRQSDFRRHGVIKLFSKHLIMYKRITFIYALLGFLTFAFLSEMHAREVVPVFDEYVQEGDAGSSDASFIYLRKANGFNRAGYLTFDLNDFNQATMAELHLTISSYRADLADPQQVDVLATGVNAIPDYSFSTQPADMDLVSLGSVTLDGNSTELTFDLLSAIQNQQNNGFRYLVVKLVSPTDNAFVQFHSLEATEGPAPFIDTDGIGEFPLYASTSGYVQENQSSFNTSLVYVRSSGGFNRVGYVAFPLTLRTPVIGATLRLTIANFSRADPSTVYISGFTGDITAGLTYDNQPDNGMLIDSISLSSADALLELDVTDYVNAAIADTDINALTFSVSSPTPDALIQFYSNEGAELPEQQPTLGVVSTCIPSFTEVEEVLCAGDTLFTATNTVTETGVYVDSLLSACGADSIIQYNAFFITDETVTIDTAICEGSSIQVFNGVDSVTYSEAGMYMDSTAVGDCVFRVITNVSLLPTPEPSLGEDITIRDDESLTLDPGDGFTTYSWSTGDSTQTISVELGADFALGPNSISVAVTNSDGCQAIEDIIVTIKDDALQPARDGAMREDQNGVFNPGDRVELKNDLFGDLNTPRGEGPFFNRQGYFGYDISEFEPTEVTSAVFRLRMTRFSPLPSNADQIETLEVPVTLSFVPELYDEDLTYENRYQGPDLIQVVTNKILTNADLNSFIEFEITDFMNQEILSQNIDEFTFVLTADNDTSSTLMYFTSVLSDIDSLHPRIVWEAMTTSVIPIVEDEATVIYPNPVRDELIVSSDRVFSKYAVMSLTGQIVQRGEYTSNRFSVSNLEPGMYILVLESDKGRFSKKFIKQE